MNAGYFWLCIGLLAAGTILIRGSVIAFSHRLQITPRMRELFTFIPAAIYPALIIPQVFFHQGHVAWLGNKERLVILILATAVSYLVRNILATLVFGLTALYFIS